jgi:bacterioferritin-associated ferredoxin
MGQQLTKSARAMPESQKAQIGMIICSCNVISDHDVREAFLSADVGLWSTAQLYNCLGCLVQCGLYCMRLDPRRLAKLGPLPSLSIVV